MRRTLVALAVIATVALSAGPAFAHFGDASGATSCSSGDHLVTWSVLNRQPKRSMTVAATAILGETAYPVDGLDGTIGPGETAQGTTTLPGAAVGTVSLSVDATWTDGFTRTFGASVDLTEPCTVTTTSVAETTTVPPETSTAPPPSAATTPSTCGGPGELACTGGGEHAPLGVALGLGASLLGAAGMAVGRRKHAVR